jgi:hypothetical protein
VVIDKRCCDRGLARTLLTKKAEAFEEFCSLESLDLIRSKLF